MGLVLTLAFDGPLVDDGGATGDDVNGRRHLEGLARLVAAQLLRPSRVVQILRSSTPR